MNNFFYIKIIFSLLIRLVSNFYDHFPSPCLSLFVSYHAYYASSKVKKFVQLVVGDKIRTVWCRHQLPYIRGDEGEGASKGRLVNEGRIGRFAEELEGWSFDVERQLGAEGNVARFWNAFRDKYDAAFPWKERKKKKKDREKPWLDDGGFKELVKEKS